jgi:hypothetical protein
MDLNLLRYDIDIIFWESWGQLMHPNVPKRAGILKNIHPGGLKYIVHTKYGPSALWVVLQPSRLNGSQDTAKLVPNYLYERLKSYTGAEPA